MPDPAPTHPPGLTRRQAGTLILGLLGAGLPSCGPVRPPRVALRGSGVPTIRPASARIDAVPGRPLVTPVKIDGPLPGSFAPTLTLADGSTTPASLYWIGVRPEPAPTTGWLPAADRWVVTAASEPVVPASVGAWHLVAQIPADAAGQAVRLDNRAFPVNWLPDPDTLRPASTDAALWAPWRTGESSHEPDADLLAPEWRSPLRRWRARLVTGALGAGAEAPQVWQLDGDPAPLDGLAQLTEDRWRVALARLWYADPEACRRLITRLTLTLELAPGVHAPAWPVAQPQLDSLLADLLEPSHTGDALSMRASVWLDSLAHAAAWIADDAAGLLGAESEPMVRIRAAAMDGRASLLWVTGKSGLRVGEPQALEPGAVAEVTQAVGRGEPRTGSRAFTVRCGTDAIVLGAREKAPIRPPGASCGPLLHDWTLEAWAESDPAPGALPAPEWAAVVLIYRDQSASSPSGWSAFVECAATREGADEVAMYFGQRGASAAVVRVSRRGLMRDEAHPEEESLLPVADNGGRWSVTVPIPREAVEPGGMLRVGIVRRDARHARTAWPRRLMPWEAEPSRAVIDLKPWSGLGGA